MAREAESPLDDLPVLRSKELQKANVLWLDKYKPKRFIDLLSDERTNREVLLWLKRWDRFVFPDKKTNLDASNSASKPSGFKQKQQQQSFGGGNGNGFKSRFDSSNNNSNNEPTAEDEDPRPFQKIILICGPPGAGKTTLANIVARHAGYNPIEVNASDDRTAGVLKNKVALISSSSLGQ